MRFPKKDLGEGSPCPCESVQPSNIGKIRVCSAERERAAPGQVRVDEAEKSDIERSSEASSHICAGTFAFICIFGTVDLVYVDAR